MACDIAMPVMVIHHTQHRVALYCLYAGELASIILIYCIGASYNALQKVKGFRL